jgi:phytoene dehydrogenase-like protein
MGQGAQLKRRLLAIGLAFLAAAAGTLFFTSRSPRFPFSGSILGADSRDGHRLRYGIFPKPQGLERHQVVIVGAGMSGLCAARELKKRGIKDFIILELEANPGGNAQSGENDVSAYPLAAHYLPIPPPEAVLVRKLLEELGVITGYRRGQPVYKEEYLCHAPQERLFIHGRWQEGLLPRLGAAPRDGLQARQFDQAMEKYKKARGRDGRKAFTIPLELSSRDPAFTGLDRMSMKDWMDQQGWDSPGLRWYVNYCCRDDYGTTLDQVSAWAGIHYFASRAGRAANAGEDSHLTWPEGMGWIAKRLAKDVEGRIRCRCAAFNVARDGGKTCVDYFDISARVSRRIECGAVIFAAPRFIGLKVIKALRDKAPAYAPAFTYAPWVVANLTVEGLQEKTGGPPLSWDNVIFDSPALGYVDANHQDLKRYAGDRRVLTWYWPLSHKDPRAARREAADCSWEDWAGAVVRDLSRPHPDIKDRIRRLDVWVWGHAMIRPIPGFIWGKNRQEALKPLGNIFFANSDMSGISIFEEAQYWGILAADGVVKLLRSRNCGQP